MKPFKSFRVTEPNKSGKIHELHLDDLTPGEVVIQSSFSSLNYKDALAVTGKGKILKRFPLNPGIDVVGKVFESSDPKFAPEDPVVIMGCNLGEIYDGGLSEIVRAPSSIIVPLPHHMKLKEAITYGTAGFTAALALLRMEANGQKPNQGPILVTGASGGVGSFAVHFFSQKGYEVHAISGKPTQYERLKRLGAHQVTHPKDLPLGHRPLEKGIWSGVIDNVGGELLSKLIPHVTLWGNISSIGLAGGFQLNGTVMPHILRGVSLLGISSNNCPWDMRLKIWEELSSHLKTIDLDIFVSQVVTLSEVFHSCESMLNRQTFGRILVEF